MRTHMKDVRMKRLLDKYRRGNISPEELKRLSMKAESMSDDEISDIIEKEWMEEGVSPKMRRMRLWTGVAAGLLIAVSAALSLSLLNSGKEHSFLASRGIEIKAGDGDKSRVVLPDGTKVILNARSSIEYRSDFGVKDRRVTLCGQGYFDVVKDSEREFTVSAQGMDVIVHGTKFNVYAYPDNDLKEVSLIEGSISLRYGDSEVKLAPNEKVCIRSGSGRINLFRTDNAIETSWIEDNIVFINRPLYQVIDVLQRHFGVTIECSSDINLADRYTGSFDEHRIEDILDILKMHYGFSYECRDNRITITNQTN